MVLITFNLILIVLHYIKTVYVLNINLKGKGIKCALTDFHTFKYFEIKLNYFYDLHPEFFYPFFCIEIKSQFTFF